jgi:hypothetical protein
MQIPRPLKYCNRENKKSLIFIFMKVFCHSYIIASFKVFEEKEFFSKSVITKNGFPIIDILGIENLYI